MKTIVVSAVNLRKGGTLTILRDCLQYLSSLSQEYRIVALVHKKELCDYEGIEYIEMPEVIKGWGKRIWCEYVTMYHISKMLSPVYLWLSLHDTTPRVVAEHRAVYCQTSFPFMKVKWNDWKFDYKIALFGFLTKLVYKINVSKNDWLIVQADWLRDGFSRMLRLPKGRFIVAPPSLRENIHLVEQSANRNICTFFYAATPDCHKNFELLCQAAQMLEDTLGKGQFQVILTIKGVENKYSQWLKQKWGDVESIVFHGLMDRTTLYNYYQSVDCLIFPSRIETWGLPISEFMSTGKPMLLADLPYAHETSAGSRLTAFFNPESPEDLMEKMLQLLKGDRSFLKPVVSKTIAEPLAEDWKALFERLLGGRNK